MEIKAYLQTRRQLVDQSLDRFMLEAQGPFSQHIQAMRYSVFAGGKRLRPILCLAAAEATHGGEDILPKALPVACALEYIHTYSLIHDDLPAMDDDELRRGKPTNHTVFGEAAAILAGDGLLTYAFQLLSDPSSAALPEKLRLQVIHCIALAAGPEGMVGGQSLDMIYEGQALGYEDLRQIHRSKTGALIIASVLAGGLVGGANEEQHSALRYYGEQIGLAFQIVDDLLDLESNTEELGKTAGSDLRAGKATYPALLGREMARAMAREAAEEAVSALDVFGAAAEPLRALAIYIVERKK